MLSILEIKNYHCRYQLLFLLVIATLYLPNYINTFFIILFVLNSLLSKSLLRYYRTNPNKKIALICLLFFGVYVSSFTYTFNLEQGYTRLQTLSTFFFFPLAYVSYPQEKLSELRNLAFVGFMIATIIVLLYFFSRYIFLLASLQTLRSFRELSQGDLHPGYFSIFIGISFFMALAVFQSLKRVSIKILVALYILLCVATLFLLQGRINIIAFIFALSAYLSIYLIKQKNYKSLMVFYISLLGGLTILFRFAPKEITYRFDEAFLKVNDISANGGLKIKDLRAYLWSAAANAIKKNFWLGVGIGDTQKALSNEYLSLNCNKLKLHHNAHNQYLETQLATGVPGTLLLLSLFYFLLRIAVKNEDGILFCATLFFFISMTTESVLVRHNGTAAFNCLLLFIGLSSVKNPPLIECRYKFAL